MILDLCPQLLPKDRNHSDILADNSIRGVVFQILHKTLHLKLLCFSVSVDVFIWLAGWLAGWSVGWLVGFVGIFY